MIFSGRFLFFIIVLAFFVLPVSADELYPTVTDFFFEKGGQPYNESLQFTVKCYGYACKSWDCQRDPADLLARNGNFSPGLVFRYQATCPQYGCRIYEPYYHAERNFGTYCDLEGVTPQGSFRIPNFSPSVIPQNCTQLRQFDIGKGNDRYYRITPEYSGCTNETRRNAEQCDEYLKTCEPKKDEKCGNWVVDGNYVKETPSYRACMDTIDRDRIKCDRYLERIDPATMILWHYPGYQDGPADRGCSLRLTIPSEEAVPDTLPVINLLSSESQKSPVESLFCGILQNLGRKCE